MAEWGLTVEDVSDPPLEVWPDNVAAIDLFFAVSTQWRSGMGGVTGLDYGGVESTLRLTGVPRSAWRDLFDDVRVMEAAALEEIHRK